MRLICGLLRLDGAPAGERLLRAMAARMAVPPLRPSLRLWRDGPVALAVLDFAARPGPASALPRTKTSVMAADVRLDEPAALAARLGAPSTEEEDALLQRALDREGPAGLDRVLGDFSFASWNGTTRRLICARDAFGIRPLAYAHRPGKFFAFASFPKALHGSGVVAAEIDEDALARQIVRTFREDDCLIADIKRLPPAHFIEISATGISLGRYWQLDRTTVGTRRCSAQEAARELRRLVDEAVRCRLPRAGEIGAHLSGGLDSSAIAVLAARRLREGGRRLHAYSFLDRPRNDIALEDETEFVKAVLEQERDIDWTPVRPAPAVAALSAAMDIDTMASLGADEPENAVCAQAQAQGVGLILSGWGGDEAATFNGRGALAELLLRGRWRILAREISALRRERGRSTTQIVRSEILSYLVPGWLIEFARSVAGAGPNVQNLLPHSLSAAVRRRLAASGEEALTLGPDGRENRWRLMTSPHIAQRAEIWAQAGARHGLAFAFPLLDRRVVEFSLSLPSELFLRGGFRRRPFRDAMAGVLPEAVRLRHQKYAPFPGQMLDLADGKAELILRIDALAQNPHIGSMIDLARVRQQAEAFPAPELVREEMSKGDNPAAAASMIAVGHAVAAASYLEQHKPWGAPPPARGGDEEGVAPPDRQDGASRRRGR